MFKQLSRVIETTSVEGREQGEQRGRCRRVIYRGAGSTRDYRYCQTSLSRLWTSRLSMIRAVARPAAARAMAAMVAAAD